MKFKCHLRALPWLNRWDIYLFYYLSTISHVQNCQPIADLRVTGWQSCASDTQEGSGFRAGTVSGLGGTLYYCTVRRMAVARTAAVYLHVCSCLFVCTARRLRLSSCFGRVQCRREGGITVFVTPLLMPLYAGILLGQPWHQDGIGNTAVAREQDSEISL